MLTFYETKRDSEEYFSFQSIRCYAHYHRAIEIVYCIKGSVNITVDGCHYLLKEGQLLFVPPASIHKYEDEPNLCLCIVIPVKYGDIYSESASGMRPKSHVFEKRDFTEDIYRHMKMLKDASPSLKNGIYCYITARLSEALEFRDIENINPENSFALNVLRYIEQHYNEELTLGSTAEALGYSRCYFSSLFKKNLKTGFNRQLNAVRIRKSLELIEDNSVYDTARLSGFNSIQSFYFNFKRVMGMTPSEFAKTQGKKAENFF